MASEDNLELFKLDPIDQKTLFWMMDNKPEAVRSWINYISNTYKRNRTLLIDAVKFFDEVEPDLHPETTAVRVKARPKNVLLVDDDRTFNFLHTRILEITGVADTITSTLNGAQAIELLKKSAGENRPDIILLDLSMPVMDGFSFLEAFRKSEIPGKENITIIIVTSSGDYRDKVRAKELGVDYFLTKPVNESELCSMVIGI